MFPVGTQEREKIRVRSLRPAARIAAALVGVGMTQKEAAAATGMHSTYLSQLGTINPLYKAAVEASTQRMIDEVTDPQTLLERSLLPALKKTLHIMENAKSDDTQLKAASSILDRGGMERASRIKSVGISIGSEDVKALADAMVASAKVNVEFAEHAEGFEAIEAVVERPIPGLAKP